MSFIRPASELGRPTIGNLDVAASPTPGQGLALDSKGNIPPSLLAGHSTYRKNTAKVVNTSVAETDLLNGEITVAANAMGANSFLRMRAIGTFKNNSGGVTDAPRWKLKLGATTLLDTGATGGAIVAPSVNNYPWTLDVTIANLGATNSQFVTFTLSMVFAGNSTATVVSFTTGTGDWGTFGDGAANAIIGANALGQNAGAVDMTASQALVFSVINASANANYETALKAALVEIL